MNVTKKELFDMIIELRERVDALTGKPQGPITMTEARLANERGDKVTFRRWLDQFKTHPYVPRKRVERPVPAGKPTNASGPVRLPGKERGTSSVSSTTNH